jgi:hypothetical protein
MAKRTTRKATNTRTGSHALEIQRDINGDYAELARDYQKLGVELWRIPATKYILGGVAVASVLPFALRGAKRLAAAYAAALEELKFRNNARRLEGHFGHVEDSLHS